jgi:septum formation protein
MGETRLILASASPRRRELLAQLGVTCICAPADIDETQHGGEHAAAYVQRMAQEKMLAIAARYPVPEYAVLAADTCVVIDDTVLGKPRDSLDALDMLLRLSGRRHVVLTAVCLHSVKATHCEIVATEVEFISLTRAVCDAYLATDEPWDKAGAYGIQGMGAAFVRAIHGSYSNVVGLPLCETWQLLCEHGIATALMPAASM